MDLVQSQIFYNPGMASTHISVIGDPNSKGTMENAACILGWDTLQASAVTARPCETSCKHKAHTNPPLPLPEPPSYKTRPVHFMPVCSQVPCFEAMLGAHNGTVASLVDKPTVYFAYSSSFIHIYIYNISIYIYRIQVRKKQNKREQGW